VDRKEKGIQERGRVEEKGESAGREGKEKDGKEKETLLAVWAV
jgi:hypothetical protein